LIGNPVNHGVFCQESDALNLFAALGAEEGFTSYSLRIIAAQPLEEHPVENGAFGMSGANCQEALTLAQGGWKRLKTIVGTSLITGSLLYLVWTQSRADYAHPGDFQLRRDLGNLLTAPGDNIFLVKATYRWSL